MSGPLVLAVDGGNSKTYLALLRVDGSLLALVRGPQSSPHHLGVEGCLAVLDGLVGDALHSAGRADLAAFEFGVERGGADRGIRQELA